MKRRRRCPILCKHDDYLAHEGKILAVKGEHSRNLLYGKIYKCRKCKRRRFVGLITLTFLSEEQFHERNIAGQNHS